MPQTNYFSFQPIKYAFSNIFTNFVVCLFNACDKLGYDKHTYHSSTNSNFSLNQRSSYVEGHLIHTYFPAMKQLTFDGWTWIFQPHFVLFLYCWRSMPNIPSRPLSIAALPWHAETNKTRFNYNAKRIWDLVVGSIHVVRCTCNHCVVCTLCICSSWYCSFVSRYMVEDVLSSFYP